MESGESKEKVILCLGGAFNPVHTRHVLAMVLVKRWLEANTNYIVVAGRLAVAPDGYVKAKSRKSQCKCIKAEHRIELCKIACSSHSEWLAPYHRPVGSAAEVGEKTKVEMIQSGTKENIHVAVIVGADRAMNKTGHAKWHKECSNITVCIGRKGETGRILEQYKKDSDANKVKHPRFLFVPDELDNVSSTAVRQVLAKLDDEGSSQKDIIDSLARDDWISEKQGQYIVQNLSELYF